MRSSTLRLRPPTMAIPPIRQFLDLIYATPELLEALKQFN